MLAELTWWGSSRMTALSWSSRREEPRDKTGVSRDGVLRRSLHCRGSRSPRCTSNCSCSSQSWFRWRELSGQVTQSEALRNKTGGGLVGRTPPGHAPSPPPPPLPRDHTESLWSESSPPQVSLLLYTGSHMHLTGKGLGPPTQHKTSNSGLAQGIKVLAAKPNRMTSVPRKN